MPMDLLLSIEQRRRRDKKEAADLRAYLVLVPLIACLFSVLLSMESHAFECAFVQLGTFGPE
jgi:hypothetical protein